MKKKSKLTKAERLEIKILLDKRYSKRDMAKALDRSPNTVSYEIKENSTNWIYDPQGTDFSKVTQEEVDRAIYYINQKPRKILGYRSAYEVAHAVGIIKDC